MSRTSSVLNACWDMNTTSSVVIIDLNGLHVDVTRHTIQLHGTIDPDNRINVRSHQQGGV
jgi:hypothetical protein